MDEISFDQQDKSLAVAKAIAFGAGEWTSIVVREVNKNLSNHRGHRPNALCSALDDLCTQGVFSSEECQKLKRVVNAFYMAIRKKDQNGAAQQEIYEILSDITANRCSSPAAIAIAVTAARNTAPQVAFAQPSEPGIAFLQVTITPETTGAGALTGAVIGAGVGGVVGGAVGAGIGAAIGAAAGAAIGYSNENEI